jgi:hypothetical protein
VTGEFVEILLQPPGFRLQSKPAVALGQRLLQEEIIKNAAILSGCGLIFEESI